MGSVIVLIFVALAVWYLATMIRKRTGLVGKRGISVGQDIATMNDQARVRVSAASRIAPDRVRVVLASDSEPDLEMVVALTADDFGDGLLREWLVAGSELAVVMPEGSHIVRLRSIESLQPVTLRRVDGP